MQFTDRERELYDQGVSDAEEGSFNQNMNDCPTYVLGYGAEIGNQETLTGQSMEVSSAAI